MTQLDRIWNGWRSHYVSSAGDRSPDGAGSVFTRILQSGLPDEDTHIIVRGVAEDGQDLVISRDYIKEGMRARAQDLVTRELGLRSDLDIHQALERQVEAERKASAAFDVLWQAKGQPSMGQGQQSVHA